MSRPRPVLLGPAVAQGEADVVTQETREPLVRRSRDKAGFPGNELLGVTVAFPAAEGSLV